MESRSGKKNSVGYSVRSCGNHLFVAKPLARRRYIVDRPKCHVGEAARPKEAKREGKRDPRVPVSGSSRA